jgi:succinate dehydrogenase / fumarate reductase, cytochrome b subunit
MSTRARPVFLDLRRIRLPVNALASILHRISGVLLILFIPVLLWLLQRSLSGPEGFAAAQDWLRHPLVLAGLLLLLWSLLHHLVAGLRYLLLEMGIGESREGARASARWAIGIGAVLALLAWGVFL